MDGVTKTVNRTLMAQVAKNDCAKFNGDSQSTRSTECARSIGMALRPERLVGNSESIDAPLRFV